MSTSEELFAMAECVWATGHEAELFGLAEDAMAMEEALRDGAERLDAAVQRLRDVYLQKALEKDEVRRAERDGISRIRWHHPKTTPQAFVPILLFLPEEEKNMTVREGYFVEDDGYHALQLGKVEPRSWAYMPEGPE